MDCYISEQNQHYTCMMNQKTTCEFITKLVFLWSANQNKKTTTLQYTLKGTLKRRRKSGCCKFTSALWKWGPIRREDRDIIQRGSWEKLRGFGGYLQSLLANIIHSPWVAGSHKYINNLKVFTQRGTLIGRHQYNSIASHFKPQRTSILGKIKNIYIFISIYSIFSETAGLKSFWQPIKW